MTKDSERGKYTSPDGSATWEYVAAVSCASLIFCSGSVAGWISPTMGILVGQDSPIPVSPSEASTLTAMGPLGHAVAPVFTVLMADKLGRKNSLLVSNIPLIISWITIATSRNIMVLIVARFTAGFSFGLTMCIAPMYLGEIASVNLRGAIGMVCGIMTNAGMLFMFTIVPYLSVTMTACIAAVITTISTISAWFIPESPYFLAIVQKFDEAEGALEKLRGKSNVAEELDLVKTTVSRKGNAGEDLELKEMGKDMVVPKKPSAMKQLFTVPGNLRAFAIIFLFTIALYLGSYMCIVIYAVIILKKMNTGVEPEMSTMIIGMIQLASNILVAFVIEKVGRKPFVCVSGLVSSLCLLVIGVYFYLMDYSEIDVTPYGLYALCALFLNVIAINIGLMPVMLVIQAEIFSTEVKALATAIAGVAGGLLGTIGAKFYYMVAEIWGYGHAVPFLGFAAITCVSTILILQLLPETKGKTLLDIQRALNA